MTEIKKIHPLQAIVLIAIIVIITGLLPLEKSVDINLTIGGLFATFGLVTVTNVVNTRLVVNALADVDFADNRIDAIFDMLQRVLGSTEPALMNPQTTITTKTTIDTPVGVASPTPVDDAVYTSMENLPDTRG